MKQTKVLFCLVFAFCSPLAAPGAPTTAQGGSPLTLAVGVDWMAGIRAGAEYLPGGRIGIRLDLGITLLGLLTADMLAAYHLLPPGSRVELNLLVGIPNLLVPLTWSAAMVSVGAGLELRWFLWRTAGIALRIGEGYPLFFEAGKPVIRPLRFPLGLWPDAVLSVVWHLRG